MANNEEPSCDDIEKGLRRSPPDRRVCAASGHGIERLQEASGELCISSESAVEDELEMGDLDIKVNADKAELDCRICHLSVEKSAAESGVAIVLGCSCKDDLAVAHKICAETWFKIKGDRICEICGSTACNVVLSEESKHTVERNEANSSVNHPSQTSETRRFWQGHRFLNFLLASLVFAFVISWLFHFNLPDF